MILRISCIFTNFTAVKLLVLPVKPRPVEMDGACIRKTSSEPKQYLERQNKKLD